jgi:hypothetical protein
VQHNSLPQSDEQQNPREENFVDARVAAAYLHCSRKHLLKLSISGKIPAHPLPGSTQRHTWRYLLTELRTSMLNSGTLIADRPHDHHGRTIGSGSPRKKGGY